MNTQALPRRVQLTDEPLVYYGLNGDILCSRCAYKYGAVRKAIAGSVPQKCKYCGVVIVNDLPY